MGNKGLLVMIDDDTDDHEILKMAVEELDRPMQCLFFPDCESAISHFNENAVVAPGYVLIDLKLPRIDGDQCLEELQRIKGCPIEAQRTDCCQHQSKQPYGG